MPASTFPTRSPPTSAPLVKIPPPRRAKIEMSDAPKPSATSEFDHHAAFGNAETEPVREEEVISGDAQERQAGDEQTGDRSGLEGQFQAFGERACGRLGRTHVRAYRDIHADEARDAGKNRADREPGGHQPAEEIADDQEDHGADNGDGRILAPQIRLRALTDRRGDLLHAAGACICRHHRLRRPDAVRDCRKAAKYDQPHRHHGLYLELVRFFQDAARASGLGSALPPDAPRAVRSARTLPKKPLRGNRSPYETPGF